MRRNTVEHSISIHSLEFIPYIRCYPTPVSLENSSNSLLDKFLARFLSFTSESNQSLSKWALSQIRASTWPTQSTKKHEGEEKRSLKRPLNTAQNVRQISISFFGWGKLAGSTLWPQNQKGGLFPKNNSWVLPLSRIRLCKSTNYFTSRGSIILFQSGGVWRVQSQRWWTNRLSTIRKLEFWYRVNNPCVTFRAFHTVPNVFYANARLKVGIYAMLSWIMLPYIKIN